MEGGLDSIHSTFLHRGAVEDDPLLKRDADSAAMIKGDASPVFLPLVSPAGLHICTRRNVGADRYFWRVTQFLMPCFNLFPPYATIHVAAMPGCRAMTRIAGGSISIT